jgi:hypothetical protein
MDLFKDDSSSSDDNDQLFENVGGAANGGKHDFMSFDTTNIIPLKP